VAKTLEAEDGIGRAIEEEASDAVTNQVTSGTVSPLSLSDLGYNADQDMLSEEPLASGFGDIQAPSPPSPFDFSVTSSEVDMIRDSLLEVGECCNF
jgi:hypothetical protein